MIKRSLTGRQKKFIREYARTCRGKQSAIAAGYCPNSAISIASKLRHHPRVGRIIDRLLDQSERKFAEEFKKKLAEDAKHKKKVEVAEWKLNESMRPVLCVDGKGNYLVDEAGNPVLLFNKEAARAALKEYWELTDPRKLAKSLSEEEIRKCKLVDKLIDRSVVITDCRDIVQ